MRFDVVGQISEQRTIAAGRRIRDLAAIEATSATSIDDDQTTAIKGTQVRRLC